VPRERWWVDAADQTDAPGPLEELSRDELIVVAGAQREVIAQLQAVVAELQSTVVALQQRVTELEHELGRHSGNSSKPPSTDTQTQRETNRSERVQPGQGRRRGKQKGADGKNLQAVADPDVRLTHRPDACCGCGGGLGSGVVVGEVRRQVFDIPTPQVIVTEHVAQTVRCGCGSETTAAFPPEATAPACYGADVKAMAIYLLVVQHLPYERAAAAMADLAGVEVATGTLVGWLRDFAQGLEPFLVWVATLLARS